MTHYSFLLHRSLFPSTVEDNNDYLLPWNFLITCYLTCTKVSTTLTSPQLKPRHREGNMVVPLLSLLLAGAAVAQNDENCLPGTWLPEGADWTSCAQPGAPYDGSKVPDCSAFHGQVNTTSFFHVHEYDCGLYWMCSPEGPCLMQCAPCNANPSTCPDGRLQFDCR